MSVFIGSVLGLAVKVHSTTGSGQYKSEAGDMISNSARVVRFRPNSIPDPLPVRTLALQLLSTSS